MIKIASLFVLAASSITLSAAYTPSTVPSSRSQFLKTIVSSAAAATILPSSSFALDNKQLNLPPNVIAAIVEKDLVENAFLTNGKLTRSIYDEKAIFTDEIDTYGLDQWIKGTSKLFVGPPGSRVALQRCTQRESL